jgi:hypothetical protein
LAVIYLLTTTASGNLILPIFTVSLIGISNGFWTYSTMNDTPILPTVFGCILLLLSLNHRKVSSFYAYLLLSGLIGIFHAIAIGFHQYNILLGFSVVFSLYRKDTMIYSIGILTYMVFLILIIFFSYYFAGVVYNKLPLEPQKKIELSGIAGGGNFYDWLFLYGHWGKEKSWGKFSRDSQDFKVWKGFTNAIYINKSSIDSMDQDLRNNIFPHFWTYIALFMYFFGFLISILLLYFKKSNSFIIYLSIIPYSILSYWWEPAHFEFWIMPWTILILGFTFVLYESISIFPHSFQIPFYTLYSVSISILISTLGYFNFKYQIHPRSESVRFGYWEDLFIKESYLDTWNQFQGRVIPSILESPEIFWENRMRSLEKIRQGMANYPERFAEFKFRFGNTFQVLKSKFPDAPEIEELQNEWNQILIGREEWFNQRKILEN